MASIFQDWDRSLFRICCRQPHHMRDSPQMHCCTCPQNLHSLQIPQCKYPLHSLCTAWMTSTIDTRHLGIQCISDIQFHPFHRSQGGNLASQMHRVQLRQKRSQTRWPRKIVSTSRTLFDWWPSWLFIPDWCPCFASIGSSWPHIDWTWHWQHLDRWLPYPQSHSFPTWCCCIWSALSMEWCATSTPKQWLHRST